MRFRCEYAVKSTLHDPDSAEFDDTAFRALANGPSGYHVMVKLRARNGFNALRAMTAICDLEKKGDDWVVTKLQQLE